MSEAAKSARPSKRDVIVIDEDEQSTNDHPVAKSTRRQEQPVPSSEVDEIQQNVLKLDNKVQSACRAARTAELRAEAAESKLDSKYGIKDDFEAEKTRADDLENRLAEVSSQMEEARRTAENALAEKIELARENESLKMELTEMRRSDISNHSEPGNSEFEERLRHLRNRLNDEQRRSKEDGMKYRARIDELTHSTDQLEVEQRLLREDRTRDRSKIEYLTGRLEEEQRRARGERTRYHASIDELTRKLAQYEVCPQSLLALQLPSTASINTDILRENEALKNEIAQMRKEHDEKVANLITQASDSQARERARIDDLTQKLAEYEEGTQALLRQLEQPLEGVAAAAIIAAQPDEVMQIRGVTYPLANADLTEKVLDLIQQATNYNQLEIGARQVENSLNLGKAEVVVIAPDLVSKNTKKVLLNIPALCQEKNVPYVFVKNQSGLARACGLTCTVVACSINRNDISQLESKIREIKQLL